MAAAMNKTETKKLIKKQRKRLREIEQLERQNRALSPDERVKVKSKRKVRKFLQTLLSEYVKESVATEEDNAENDDREETIPHVSGDGNQDCDRPQKRTGEDHTPQKTEANTRTVSQKNEEVKVKKHLEDRGSDERQVGKACDEKVKEPARVSASGHVPAREVKKDPQSKDKGSGEDRARKVDDVKVKLATPIPASGDETKPKKKKPSKPSLSTKSFKVTYLEGHSDLITAVVIHKETIVTASRDTTVKTWDLVTGAQKKNFGGHTNSVTCLIVLDLKDAQQSVPDLPTSEEEPIVISGSFDCTLKIWSLDSGHLLKSIYTYNPVSQISYTSELSLLVLGSDTGKLELWDLEKGEQQYSLHAYDASVTGIKVVDKQLQSSASDGTIKIFSITDSMQLSCVFESENVLSTTGRRLTPRHILSLEQCDKGTLIGDDAVNIKVLNWKKNEASKIPNHHSDFSSTDAIRCRGDYVVASSYDLDSGLGYLNVRSSRSLEYQATLDDKDTERILCLDVSVLPSGGGGSGGSLVVVTGGVDLKVWEVLKQHSQSDDGDDVFQAEFREALAGAAVDSEDEDDDDEYDDEDDDDSADEHGSRSRSKKIGFQQEAETWSWTSWCSVI